MQINHVSDDVLKLLVFSDERWQVLPSIPISYQTKTLKIGAFICQPICCAYKDNLWCFIVLAKSAKQEKIVRLLLDSDKKDQIISSETLYLMHQGWNEYHIPNHEDLRIFNKAFNLMGVTYYPLLCSVNASVRMYICLSQIHDEKQSRRMISVQVNLNMSGFYEIQEVQDLLPMRRFTNEHEKSILD